MLKNKLAKNYLFKKIIENKELLNRFEFEITLLTYSIDRDF